MKPLLAASLLAACAAALPAGPALAQAASGNRIDLPIAGEQTLSVTRAIDRIEVDREGVIAVSAPTARSLRLSAIGQGRTTLRVFDREGDVLAERLVTVASAAATRSGLVPGEKVVAVEVQFAAVSSSTLKALGFSFSKLAGDLQGAVVSPSSLNSASFGGGGLTIDQSAPIQSAFNLFLSAPNRGIGAVLSTLSSNGLSQLLAQPTLLVRSGEEASFLAGGEFPVPIPQNSGGATNTISIQYKEFGVRLSVTPFVLSDEHIVLKLAPEVSELDYGNGVQLQGYVVPGIRRRSAETTVELGSGQSFVIAGLNYSNSSVTKDKVPFLGDIPVLGAFFKRQENQKEKQELIIIATPRLVEPGAIPTSFRQAGEPLDPTIGDMILGTDGVEQAVGGGAFGIVRR